MKTLKGAVALLIGATALFARDFKLGGSVSGFSVSDTAGKAISFGELRGRVTVVAFYSTTCPISNAFNDRMSALFRDYAGKDVKFIFLNANANEMPADMIEHARSAGFTFPIYKDAGNKVADRFGATATPETFVIDAKNTVRYHGYIDDAQNPARVHAHGLRDALDAVLEDRPVANPETKAFGCTIKRTRRTT